MGRTSRQDELADLRQYEKDCREAEGDYATAFDKLRSLVEEWKDGRPSTNETMVRFVDQAAQQLQTMRLSASWLTEAEQPQWRVVVFRREFDSEIWIREGERTYEDEGLAKEVFLEVGNRRAHWAALVDNVCYRIELQHRASRRRHFTVVEVR